MHEAVNPLEKAEQAGLVSQYTGLAERVSRSKESITHARLLRALRYGARQGDEMAGEFADLLESLEDTPPSRGTPVDLTVLIRDDSVQLLSPQAGLVGSVVVETSSEEGDADAVVRSVDVFEPPLSQDSNKSELRTFVLKGFKDGEAATLPVRAHTAAEAVSLATASEPGFTLEQTPPEAEPASGSRPDEAGNSEHSKHFIRMG